LAKIPGTHFVLLNVIETPRSERNLGAFASEENKAKLEFRREQAMHHLEAVCVKNFRPQVHSVRPTSGSAFPTMRS
jgi:hypothetical protein